MVEHQKRLRGDRRYAPLDDDVVLAGEIENLEQLVRAVAKRWRVHAPSMIGEYIIVFSRELSPLLREDFRISDVRATDAPIELPADDKHRITDRFGVESAPVRP